MKFTEASKELENVLTNQATVTVKKLKKILGALNISNRGIVRTTNDKVLKNRIKELDAKVKRQAVACNNESKRRRQLQEENELLKLEVAKLREKKAKQKA